MSAAPERSILHALAAAADAIATGLDEALELIGSSPPRTAEAFEALDKVQRTATAALLKRFEQLQDVLARMFRTALIDGPRYLRDLPLVRRIVDSKAFDLWWRWLVKPGGFAIGTFLVLRKSKIDTSSSALLSGMIFVVLVPLLNSRLGRDLEEWVAEHASGTWRWLCVDLLPGLYRTIMDGFRHMLGEPESCLLSTSASFSIDWPTSHCTYAGFSPFAARGSATLRRMLPPRRFARGRSRRGRAGYSCSS